jgi:hypothetical protein
MVAGFPSGYVADSHGRPLKAGSGREEGRGRLPVTAAPGADRPGTAAEVAGVDLRRDLGFGMAVLPASPATPVNAGLGTPEPAPALPEDPDARATPAMRLPGRLIAAFEARPIQHQLDHLDSVLFLDPVPGAWTIRRLEQGVV